MKKTLLALVATLAVLAGLPGAPASAATVDRSPTVKTTARNAGAPTSWTVVAAHGIDNGRLAVVFQDGRSFDVRPCAYEDGNRCWWDAGLWGNKTGHTFVQLRGRTIYLT